MRERFLTEVIDQLKAETERLKVDRSVLLDLCERQREALGWIGDETKRDHKEPDLYTKYGCVLHKANEALALTEERLSKLGEA